MNLSKAWKHLIMASLAKAVYWVTYPGAKLYDRIQSKRL